MQDSEKKKQLNKHKSLATGLFLLMTVLFVVMIFLQKNNPAAWIGYVKAFAEAAMVGALADWFAVTALFHHPLGLPIPHTNLIENSKKRIGDNLGNFVVDNFLSSANLRPYISRIKLASVAGEWLSKEKNQQLLIREISNLLRDVILKLDDKEVSNFLARKASALLEDLPLPKLAAGTLQYVIDHNEHEKLISLLAQKIKGFIEENGDLVREKVQQESYFFIPGFVDRKLADKITVGLVKYFEDIETDTSHRVRMEIVTQMQNFVQSLQTEPEWETKFATIRQNLLGPEKIGEYTGRAWEGIKKMLLEELHDEQSQLKKYILRSVNDFAQELLTDETMQQKIDGWIRHTAYRYILKNSKEAGTLISNTVGNWQGRELSQKLELEVGKDLQFIRINGTLVGGLVGLILYIISQLF